MNYWITYSDKNYMSDFRNERATNRLNNLGQRIDRNMQRENTLTTGNSYSVPSPVICDTKNSCVILDFNAYPAEEPTEQNNKGTDIMYIVNQKIQRIDTLRHTLKQPQWVINHFTNTT
jgi:hypothetical protein